MKKVLSLDIKYSGIQILYFGSFAALMGFASVYLLSKGFSNSMIGIALASVSAIAVFTQPTVAAFADKNQHIELRKIVAALLVVISLLSASVLILGKGSIILLCAFVGIATLLTTLTPLLNSMAFVFEKYGIEINFGLGRGLGSAAYALISFLLGYLVEDFGVNILPMVYLTMNILMIFIVYTFVVPKTEQKEMDEEVKEEVKEQLSFIGFCKKYKKFMIFVLGLVFVYFIHTIINNFLIQIVTNVGGSESDMGTAVFIAAILELPAMLFFNTLREKVKCATLIRFAVIMFLVKHVLTYLAGNVFMLYVAQACQMAGFAILTPAGVYYVNETIHRNDAVKGQSMVTMAYTASGIIANLVGGILLDAIGVHQVLFCGIITSIIGAVIVFIGVDNKKVTE